MWQERTSERGAVGAPQVFAPGGGQWLHGKPQRPHLRWVCLGLGLSDPCDNDPWASPAKRLLSHSRGLGGRSSSLPLCVCVPVSHQQSHGLEVSETLVPH